MSPIGVSRDDTMRTNRYFGYGALICAVFTVVLLSVDRFAWSLPYVLFVLAPLGLYLAIRGLFVGTRFGRGCAMLSFVVWIGLIYNVIVSMAAVRT